MYLLLITVKDLRVVSTKRPEERRHTLFIPHMRRNMAWRD